MDEHKALEEAIEAAKNSPCSKSKRGVIIWDGRSGAGRWSSGFNGPPAGFTCDGSDACRESCGMICVHAEIRALMHVGREHTDLLHVKVKAGQPVASGPPSCPHCSKAILDRGISRVWLLHETGLRLYSAEDFHVQTLLNCKLPIIKDVRKGE